MAKNFTHYCVTQIIPAQPDTFALFREVDGRLLRVPVPAWGIWDSDTYDPKEESTTTGHGVGPLVLCRGRLEPAEATLNFAGVRIESCVEFNGVTHYDTDRGSPYESDTSALAIASTKK